MNNINKRSLLKHRFEAFQVFLVVGVLVFLFIYASLGVYLKFLAREAVDQAISKIEATDPNINNIKYTRLQFSLKDFFKQQLTLSGVTFHLNNPNINVALDTLTLQHFMSFTKDPLGPFTVTFTGAHVDQFASLYGMVTTWLNNPYLYSEFGNVPNQLDLNLDGSANYLPQNNHETDLTLTLKNKNLALFTYQIKVNRLNLTAGFFNNLPVFLGALMQSEIAHIHYQANITYTVTAQEIASIAPGFSQYLQALGYQNLPITINGNSDYNAKDTQETYHFNIAVKNMGVLNTAINYQIINPPSLYTTANQLLGTNNTNTSAPDLIQSANVSYQDNSLMSRVLEHMAQTSNQSVTTTKNALIASVNNLAQNLNLPQMNLIATQLNIFILDPQTLTVYLQPTTPFSIDDIANFFASQQQRNQAIQTRLAKLKGAARTKAYNAYSQQSMNAYSRFFNRIGLSMVANINP
jgi:hypothetical protein